MTISRSRQVRTIGGGSLARLKRGAIVAIQGEVGLEEYAETGSPVGAPVSAEMLKTIFTPYTPLHDGAVIIRDGKVAAAGCLLPLSMDSEISNDMGTRHRAAIGLTKETDAAVIIISEETGTMSLALDGRITRNLDAPALGKILQRLCQRKRRRGFRLKTGKFVDRVSH